MSADRPSGEWVPPGQVSPSESHGLTAASRWPPAPPMPAASPWPPAPLMPQTPPKHLMARLADPAASPLVTTAAAVTAAGWCAAAAIMTATVVTGHAQAAAAGAAVASAFVLAVVDLVTSISFSLRRRAQPAPPGAARALRKATRRARRSAGAGSGVVPALRGTAGILRRPARFPFLPRPARWGFAAMLWLTALTTAWVMARGLFAWDLATARGQQLFAAWAWMMHLVTWCRIACSRLNRSRSDASMLTSAPTADL